MPYFGTRTLLYLNIIIYNHISVSAGFTAAGGLVLTAGTSAFTIPTIALLGAKAIAIKGLLLSTLLGGLFSQ